MATTVVHARKEQFDIYIGRKFKEFPQSILHNPFHIGQRCTRTEAIDKFRNYALDRIRRGDQPFIDAVSACRGKVLGCWCEPLDCHGWIIANLADIDNWENLL